MIDNCSRHPSISLVSGLLLASVILIACQPSTAVETESAIETEMLPPPIYRLILTPYVDEETGLPLEAGSPYPAGINRLYATFEYDGTQDGQRWSAIWYQDGVELPECSFYDETWNLGKSGTSWVSAASQGWPAGEYVIEFYIDGELVAIAGAHLADELGDLPVDENVEIAQWRTYRDDYGDLHVVGELVNRSDGYLEGVRVTVLMYNAEGELIVSDIGEPMQSVLVPGQFYPFDVIIWDAPQEEDIYVELAVASAPSETEPYLAVELFPGDTWFDEDGDLIFEGSVENNHSMAIAAHVCVTLYGSDGAVVAAGQSYAETVLLAEGESALYRILVLAPPDEIADQTFCVQGERVLADFLLAE